MAKAKKKKESARAERKRAQTMALLRQFFRARAAAIEAGVSNDNLGSLLNMAGTLAWRWPVQRPTALVKEMEACTERWGWDWETA